MKASIHLALVLGSALACNAAGRAGPSGSSNDGRVAAFAPADAAPPAEPARVEPSPPLGGSAPAVQSSAARPSSEASIGERAATPLVSRCPQQFADDRHAKCRWSTGLFRYCGGAAPAEGADQPREGCVCNECILDRDCDGRRGGRCLEFPDEKNCGPAAKACIYPGDPCAPPSKCKAPDRCMHDELGHAACSPPPVPHM
jgi:hypothetical protein